MFFSYIKRALRAAKYHEDSAFSYAHPSNADYDKVIYHLRAYFWELLSIWEYVLQEVNSQTLKLEPDKVRSDFLKKLRSRNAQYKYLEDLEHFDNEDRFYRIRFIRNYAHKWQIDPSLVDYTGDKVNVISLSKLNNYNKIPNQINIDRNDLFFLEELVKSLSEKGFFNHDEKI